MTAPVDEQCAHADAREWAPVDLHTHTVISDGRLTPRELIAAAAAARISTLVITDHSAVTWSSELVAYAAEMDVEIPFPGIEISTVFGGERYHIVGLGHGCLDPEFAAFAAWPNLAKNARIGRALDLLRAADERVPSLDHALHGLVPGGIARYPDRRLASRSVTSTVLAAALSCPEDEARQRLDRALRDADRDDPWLASSEQTYLPTDELIRRLVAVGAIPVLAHPLWRMRSPDAERGRLYSDIREFTDLGLRAAEVASYHHVVPGVDTALLDFIKATGLDRSGGSDFHGNGKSSLGRYGLTVQEFKQLGDPKVAPGSPGPADRLREPATSSRAGTREISIPFGTGAQTARVPESAVVIGPQQRPAYCDIDHRPDDLAGVINASLDEDLSALGSQLSGARCVAVCVTDGTRATPIGLLLPPLLQEIDRRCLDSTRIECVIATGLHAPTGFDETAKVVADSGLGNRVQLTVHDPYATDLECAGTAGNGIEVWINRKVATANVVFCVGTVAPHPEAGFSGGAKCVLPGAAGASTVRALHQLAREPLKLRGVLDANPFRAFLEEGSGLLECVHILNAVLCPCGQVTDVVCGPAVAGHRRAAARFASRYGVRPPGQADILVIGAGGTPTDSTLYLAEGKAWRVGLGLPPARIATILTGACNLGVGNADLAQALFGASSSEHATRKARFLRELIARSPATYLVHAGLPGNVTSSLRPATAVSTLQEAVDHALRARPDARMTVLPNPNYLVWTPEPA